jgi:hypothetical protein
VVELPPIMRVFTADGEGVALVMRVALPKVRGSAPRMRPFPPMVTVLP